MFMLAAYTALVQSKASKSPAEEPPLNVRKGRTWLVGHFNDPRLLVCVLCAGSLYFKADA